MKDAPAELLKQMTKSFRTRREPLDVCFRNIMPRPHPDGSATHLLHSYPAKLHPSIAAFFLSTDLSREGELVLDPFCGSGTVLLEAILRGRNASGADSNPLARLITRAKTSPLSDKKLDNAAELYFAARPLSAQTPDVVNRDLWFYPHIQRGLSDLVARLDALKAGPCRDFFAATLSSCIKDLSLADPRLSVPVRLRPERYSKGHWLRVKAEAKLAALRSQSPESYFHRRLAANSAQMRQLANWKGLGKRGIVGRDARNLSHLSSGTVDLVITSPPYLGAQKYIRASSLSLTWLKLCGSTELRSLEDENIGREHFRKKLIDADDDSGHKHADALIEKVRRRNPLRAHIATTYLREMRASLEEVHRVLRSKGSAILVVGASDLSGVRFDTPRYLSDIATDVGFAIQLHLVDRIRSRALMTKRHHTAGIIATESVILLRKH